MRKKGLSKVMVWAVMSLYDGAKTRVRVGSEYTVEYEVKAEYTSRTCTVTTIIYNICGHYFRRCKKRFG